MILYEYATTTASAHPLGGDQDVTPPKSPGDGWELVASSANERTRFHDWRRALDMTPAGSAARAKKT